MTHICVVKWNLIVWNDYLLLIQLEVMISEPLHTKHVEYRKITNIRRTNSPNINVSHLILQLSFLNPMKPGVKSRMNRHFFLLIKVRLILETWRYPLTLIHQHSGLHDNHFTEVEKKELYFMKTGLPYSKNIMPLLPQCKLCFPNMCSVL